VRFLILSDIHANSEGLDAVLTDAAGEYDTVVCCGDIVGYNPDPMHAIEWCRSNCQSIVRGNHDKVIAGIDDLDWFNPIAQASARWTMKQLPDDDLTYLRELPKGPMAVADAFQIFHGAPFDEDEYVLSPDTAEECFSHLDAPVAFFGHTHVQGGFFQKHRRLGGMGRPSPGEAELVFELEPNTMYIVNAGSVGQPRDRDPRAAYAIYDSEQRLVRLRRVEYDVAKTVEKIRAAGLPDALGLRLFDGQ
jgi:predicted phosphodiesterase